MKYLLIGTFTFIFLQNCSAQLNDLSKTRWEFKDDNHMTDYIYFIDDEKYEFYSSESMLTYSGIYFVKSDTINLIRLYSDASSNMPKHSKMVVENDKIFFVRTYTLKKGVWEEVSHPPRDYSFIKQD
ncbi:hypothetical protein [Marivirga lumbricoides]